MKLRRILETWGAPHSAFRDASIAEKARAAGWSHCNPSRFIETVAVRRLVLLLRVFSAITLMIGCIDHR